jgi:ComF family protein
MPESLTCGRCLRAPPAFDAALAAFEYRFPLDRLVHRFKFAGDVAVGRWLGRELARRVEGTGADLLAAVPLTRARLAARGFNQALEIAREVGRETGIRVEPRALSRLRETTPQPGLGAQARRENLQGAFRCDARVAGLEVALVDDVMTTGATAQAIADALKAAGASRVSVWAVARTPRPHD